MDAKEILAKVDHTLLKQTATWADIQKICEEASEYHTATVMVPSCFITKIRENYGGKVKIATVVGFPNGNCNTAAKIAETAQALADGAEEIDMVINIGMLKDKEDAYVRDEIHALKEACGEAGKYTLVVYGTGGHSDIRNLIYIEINSFFFD